MKMNAEQRKYAQRRLKHGAMFPYDAGDSWWQSEDEENPPPPAVDWAHAAARGVLADLGDRRGIKNSLDGLDEDIKAELVETIADIIREAKEPE